MSISECLSLTGEGMRERLRWFPAPGLPREEVGLKQGEIESLDRDDTLPVRMR